jgi:hypothetical protein
MADQHGGLDPQRVKHRAQLGLVVGAGEARGIRAVGAPVAEPVEGTLSASY